MRMTDEQPSCETHNLRLEKLEFDMIEVRHSLYGSEGRMGIVTTLAILWRLHIVWPMMFIGMAMGSVITLAVTHFVKVLQ